MSSWQVYTIGFIAQALFSARLLLQWIASEKQKKVLTPSNFWKVSLFASFLLFVYGYLRSDFSIMLGQALTYFIYIRNMQLQGEWKKMSRWLQLFLYFFPVILFIYSYNNNVYDVQNLFYNDKIPLWLLVLGSTAQVIFTLRFVYQWVYSERIKKSVLPMGFWLLSFAGAVLILIYAILRKDPVLFVGHLAGSVIYVRNMVLIRREDD
ncbi:lipid-A-disaccharide synthase N-terminal domain-containing protein [Salinimicrobium sediminilitoris]|uniref:lipid-A-disaccharide synthase N-terminal domain-containing protein n=1 Tax=Salinimicrobium sediminilitoris TaxID=2876715 RepID=UPI001E5513F3|nr:lipid-A-disaccharide synthase N-terminal domain-containing protein [Salinimicrobium sediminilitoris]MCC8360755.1 lipid-A-disaccharide synthase N-terminal domain-containing protein [Salinimicrobium sediminilitoris]